MVVRAEPAVSPAINGVNTSTTDTPIATDATMASARACAFMHLPLPAPPPAIPKACRILRHGE
ncbi:hypothetical protein Acsp02_57250 [Actinoplanes sp. NBRC 103695]|nr:hypothetical protein Acsp02_57250 [Actinoplanes sp. NBRC 103695]